MNKAFFMMVAASLLATPALIFAQTDEQSASVYAPYAPLSEDTLAFLCGVSRMADLMVGDSPAPDATSKRYPELPPNMDRITECDEYNMCVTFHSSLANINLRRYIGNIERYYGDKNEFFNKYILSLGCSPGYMSFSDSFLKGSRSLLMTMFTNYTKKFGKFDRNAYIRIKRDGKIYEGPLQYVFMKLNEKFPDNREYSNILVITRIPDVFFKGEMKTCEQMQREDPLFPCRLP